MSVKTFGKDQRSYSSVVVDGIERAPGRALLRAQGFNDLDFRKPEIGIASILGRATSSNLHISHLAGEAEKGIRVSGGKAVSFSAVSIVNGMSAGAEGMKYSLVARESIADSIESVTAAEGFDGLVIFGGCDKHLPGCLMAMARLNRPSVFVFGGHIERGCYCEKNIDLVSIAEGVGRQASGEVSMEQFVQLERDVVSGAGVCAGADAAGIMALAIEALGMSLPNGSFRLAGSKGKFEEAHAAGRAVVQLIEQGIRPAKILTRPAFLNAVTVVMALGGSTDAVLHLLAMAKSANVRLRLSDFDAIGKKVPVLADLKPMGKYSMVELSAIGGVAPLMVRLLKEGLLDGHCMTVSGKMLKDNLALVKPYPRTQNIIRSFSRPLKPSGHLIVLKGNLAPEGAVARVACKGMDAFSGKALVFNSEEQALKKILDGTVKPGHVVVIRYEGPKGGPGMREMLSPASAVIGRGLERDVALISDGRFFGGSAGVLVGHIAPEAFVGGPLALVKNGDPIRIDLKKRQIELQLSTAEMTQRSKAWKPPRAKYRSGVLAKYAKLVGSASEGAVTDG